MPERDTKRSAPAPECHIVEIVIKNRARHIVGLFLAGDNPRKIARIYGLSRGGVEQLIREHARLRLGRGNRKAAR